MQNPYRQQENNISCILVPSSANFDQVTIAPGQKVMVMSQSEPLFAMKSADQMGFVSTRYCSFSEYDPAAATQQKESDFEARLRRLEEIVNGKPAE